jgi:hypothetical protein
MNDFYTDHAHVYGVTARSINRAHRAHRAHHHLSPLRTRARLPVTVVLHRHESAKGAAGRLSSVRRTTRFEVAEFGIRMQWSGQVPKESKPWIYSELPFWLPFLSLVLCFVGRPYHTKNPPRPKV